MIKESINLIAGSPAPISRLMSAELGEEEKNKLLVTWNDTTQEYPRDKCIHEIFEAQAAKTPEATALVFGEVQLTYRELNHRANQLACHLRTLDVQPDALVGMFMERSLEIIVGILGILKAGGAYVPIDPHYPQERLIFMLKDAGLTMVLTESNLASTIPVQKETKIVCLDKVLNAKVDADSSNLSVISKSKNLAYVIYTSGSAGCPKGILVTHQNLMNSTYARLHYYDEPVGGFLLLSSYAFDSSVAGIFWTLCQGGKLVLPLPGYERDPVELAKLICEHEVSHLLCVPTVYELLLAGEKAADLKSLRVAIVAGETCPAGLPNRHFQKVPSTKLYNEYGPTECTVWTTAYQIKKEIPENGLPVGRPIGNTQVYLLDEQLQPVPTGATGELCVGGDGVTQGYLNRPELTAEKFITNPFNKKSGTRLYKTGDLARYLPDGNIEFLGRIDQQVKIRGFRIELGEIETVLSMHQNVLNCVVIAREDVSGQKFLAAYLVVHYQPAPSIEKLKDFLKQKLPDHMVPAAFIILPALPQTPNGKIDRKNLPAPKRLFETGDRFVAPETPREQAVVSIWQDVLQLPGIGLEQNFFDAGGNSIHAAQVHARLQKLVGWHFPITDLFTHTTVRALVAHFDSSKNVEGTSNSNMIRAQRQREAFSVPRNLWRHKK